MFVYMLLVMYVALHWVRQRECLRIRTAVRNAPQFRFDWFIKSRTALVSVSLQKHFTKFFQLLLKEYFL